MKEPGFEEEREMLELIDQRDRAEEYADKLADVVAALLGVELGEHSSGNNPWQAALDAYNERPPASPASAPVGKVYHCDPDNGRDDGEMAAEFNCRLPEGTKLYASPQLVLGEPVSIVVHSYGWNFDGSAVIHTDEASVRALKNSGFKLGQSLYASPPSPTLERVREALEASRIAIDDWLHTFAPDECGDFYVEQTSTRIMDAGGTPAYIAQVQQKNRTALALLQRRKDGLL